MEKRVGMGRKTNQLDWSDIRCAFRLCTIHCTTSLWVRWPSTLCIRVHMQNIISLVLEGYRLFLTFLFCFLSFLLLPCPHIDSDHNKAKPNASVMWFVAKTLRYSASDSPHTEMPNKLQVLSPTRIFIYIINCWQQPTHLVQQVTQIMISAWRHLFGYFALFCWRNRGPLFVAAQGEIRSACILSHLLNAVWLIV